MGDEKLIEALRLLSERPDVLRAALEQAERTAQERAQQTTVAQLWEEFAPWGARNIPSWALNETNWRVIARTKLPVGNRGASIAELRVDELNPEVFDSYRATREASPNNRGGTISPSTVNREITCLRSCFNYHMKVTRKLKISPTVGVELANEEQYARRGYLTPEQMERFLATAHPVFQDIVWCCYRCVGMRNAESRLLKKAEVDWEARVIRLPAKRTKARTFRVVPFPDDVEVILKRHCENSRGPFVFVNPRDPRREAPVPQHTFQRWLKAARRDSGMHSIDGESLVVHHARHSAVTQLVADGAAESMIKAAAGMSDRTFRRYAKFSPDQWEQLRQRLNRQRVPHVAIVDESRKPPQPQRFGRPVSKKASNQD